MWLIFHAWYGQWQKLCIYHIVLKDHKYVFANERTLKIFLSMTVRDNIIETVLRHYTVTIIGLAEYHEKKEKI